MRRVLVRPWVAATLCFEPWENIRRPIKKVFGALTNTLVDDNDVLLNLFNQWRQNPSKFTVELTSIVPTYRARLTSLLIVISSPPVKAQRPSDPMYQVKASHGVLRVVSVTVVEEKYGLVALPSGFVMTLDGSQGSRLVTSQ